MDRKTHWDQIYSTKRPEQLSWYQRYAHLSLALIQGVAPDKSASILDVGGGASVVVDDLLSAGYRHLTVLDISQNALVMVQERLGSAADAVNWLEADVLEEELPQSAFDVWHDRAVFHFLTAVADQQRYVSQVRRALVPGGHVVIATFAEDGPTRCSGLEVQRYTPEQLSAVFGGAFRVVESRTEVHITPAGKSQIFAYIVMRCGF